MRNLVPLRRAAWRLPHGATDESKDQLTAFAVNASEGVVYMLHATSGRIDVLATDDDEETPAELLVELSSAILTADGAQWQWIDYIAELDAVVCGSSSGALAVVDLQTREPEEIGSLDGGIVGMAWSSNQETLAIATGIGSLLVMNTQWEVLYETQLQAHLPEGLTLQPTSVINMKWRDDAQYLVLNVEAVEKSNSVRKVLVFTQQLELHAIGRLEDGRVIPHLGDSIDWSPNHSLITSHETRKGQLFVVFFERNGLRHGEFALPAEYTASTTVVKQIQWNIHSDVVAVHIESPGVVSRLLLWTRNNYHWYLKQEISFDLTEDQATLGSFKWDDERATRLHAVLASTATKATRYEQFEFAWDVSIGKRRLYNGQSSVVAAVVDGNKLLLTPLHQALVPPPMALHTLTFDAPVNSVVFDAFHELLAVSLSNGDVVLVDQFLKSDDSAPVSRRKVRVDSSINALIYVRVDPSTKTTVLAGKARSNDALVVWSVDSSDCGDLDQNANVLIPSDEVFGVRRATEIISVESGVAASNGFALQRGDGCIVRVSIEGEDVFVSAEPSTKPAGIQVFSRVEVIELSQPTRRILTIGLTAATSKLLVDGKQVSPAACSSFHFCAFSSVLLYTTLGNTAELRMVPLAALVAESFENNGEHRVIERGARLVAVIGDRASVVVQMPRGNLEGTSPRLLVLALVAKQIERLEYAKALEMSRRHRLDLNLLVDYDESKFLANFAEHLIDSLLAPRGASVTSDRLCLFITNLHIVDVWKTKYGPQLSPFLTSPVDSTDADFAEGQERVNLVCQRMMGVMQALEADHKDALLLPLLTAAVKQFPPDFHTALTHVQQLIASADVPRAKRAMKHLIFLTQVDTLFDEALGMYDLALVRFVATYSQRDPKDYMPFLDECETTEDELVRRYKIDGFLKRHAKALTHVSELLQRNDLAETVAAQYEAEAAQLVVHGTLYDEALALFSKSSSNALVQQLHRRVLQLKAQYLSAQGQFEDAGYVFLSIDDYSEAMQAFKSARSWRMALACASRALNDGVALRAFAYEVVKALVNQKEVSHDDLLAAARVYTEHCDDVDEAVALLVSHKQWDEAVRVAFLHKRADLIETDVETGVAVAYDAITDDIMQRQAEYVKHWKRLTTIREQKRLFKLHGIDGSRWESNDGADGDSQSVVSGAASSVADSALSAASSLRSVGSHNSAVRGIGNFSMKSLATATSSHFYATQSLGNGADAAAAAAAYKSKRYGGMPSRQERRRRIKEGSVEEEVHVAQQLRANAPSSALRRETRDVLRVLVFFGRSAKAEALQAKLSAFEATVRDEYPMLEMPANAAATGVATETHTTQEATPSSSQSRGDVETATATEVAWRFPAFVAKS